MRADQRVVTRGPLTVLWDASGDLQLTKQREVGREQVAGLLRQGPVRFVLANCGHPLMWVPADDKFRFWKAEVKPRLVEPSEVEKGFRLEDYPGEYCYIGTEWGGQGKVPVVLVEMCH